MATEFDGVLPVDVIFHPDWWHSHYGLDFREPFHFDPAVRVESERLMRQALFERFGDLGLGDVDNDGHVLFADISTIIPGLGLTASSDDRRDVDGDGGLDFIAGNAGDSPADTRPSRMASAMVGSPICSCQCSTGS